MRKLFAMVATVAVVLSMFAGIAFAAPGDKVLLNTTAVMSSGAAMGLQPVSGSLVDSATGTLWATAIKVEVEDASAAVLDSRTFSNGSFTVYVPTNLAAQTLTVKVYDNTVAPAVLQASATLPVKYNVTLANALDYVYSADLVPVAISGYVKDTAGKAVVGAGVQLDLVQLDGTVTNLFTLASGATGTDTNGFFGKYVTFSAAGTLKLYVNGIEHVTGKVAAVGMELSVSPNTNIVHTIAPTSMTYIVSNGPALQNVAIEIYDSSKALVHTATAGTALGNDGYLKLANINWTPSAAGTYTVKATVGTTHQTSTTVEVVNPATYNLINRAELESMPIGGKTLDFDTTRPAPIVELVRYAIIGGVAKVDNTFAPLYVVTVDGKVLLDQRTTPATKQVALTATALGTKTVRLQAYEAATLVWDQTFTMAITGWDVNVSSTELTVNTAKDIVVVVKDEKGNLINNATVELTLPSVAVKTITPATNNISNGVYTFTGAIGTTPGTGTIKIYEDAAKTKQKASFNVEVLGNKAYTVSPNATVLLLGKGTKVQLTVTENGATFIPAVLKMQVGTAAPTVQNFTAIDANKDGVFDTIETTITPANTKDITLRAENATGSKRGDVVLTVKAAKLEVISNGKLTRDFTDKVSFRIVNPIDNTVIKENVTLVDNYVTTTVKDANGGVSGKVLLGAAEYNVQIQSVPSAAALTWAADEAAAKAAEKPIAVTLQVYGNDVDGSFLVEPAKIVSNPAEVVIGQANNLTLTYQDANGNPIVGKKISVGTGVSATLIAKSDDKGQVVYATTGAVSFEAETESATRPVTLSVSAVVDTKAPVVTAPATTDKGTATITVTDNVRVARLMVNGVELNIIPRAELNHVVTLKAGVNTFEVIAVDNNYNVVEQTVTITYTPAANNSTVLQGGAVERKGDYVFVQIRQFEDLGATLTWNGTAKTATFVAGGKTVEVTVGSTTAKVNGAAATMPAAPILVNGRVMVPTRFIAEALGWKVDWAAGDIVTITLP